MNRVVRKYLTVPYLLLFFSLIAGWPAVFYLLGWLPDYKVSYVALLGACLLLLFLGGKQLAIPRPIFLMIGLQIAIWFIYSVIFSDTSYYTRIFYLVLTLLLLNIQIHYTGVGFVKMYNNWITLQVVLGVIGFVLFMLGILKPFFIFLEMDHRPGYFFGFFTTNTLRDGFIRVAGYFDEPGALACWGIYALLLNKLFIKNSKIEYILMGGLVVTLSMAYFIQLAAYIYFFFKKQRSKILIPLVFVFILLKIIAFQNEAFDQAIFGRFEYDKSEGRLNGDNRSDLMDVGWKIFKESPVIGIGAENLTTGPASRKFGFVGANIFTFLATDGLIGQLIIWLPIFFLFYLGKRQKEYRYAALICMIGFFQRPYDCTQLLYPLLTYSMVLYAYKKGAR